nr:uncharacterized protein LOC129152458 isoform X1 [Nothobranchius furzeri]
MEGESTESGTTSTQAETLDCNQEHDDPQSPQKPEEENRDERGACDEEKAGEDLCVGAETSQQEEVMTTHTQDDENGLPRSNLSTEEKTADASVPPTPSITKNPPPGPCWYCLRSLDSEFRPQTSEKEDSDSDPSLTVSGQKVTYQTDPRPHFGVAWSSHSPGRPLWGSEGPCWGQRNQEKTDQTDTCPHCHLGLPLDTLRWHEAKCLQFDGLGSSKE